MLNLVVDRDRDQPFRILCLGAHSDDIEIGCGGTVLRLVEEFTALHVDWIVFSGEGARADEARNSAISFLNGAAETNTVVRDFRDGFFPYIGADIKAYFEEIKRTIEPDLIFTHYRKDLHQDHRVINELTWNTFRDHMILEYEIPKYDGDLHACNVFVPLATAHCDTKIEYLQRHFGTQAGKHWFSRETFRSILTLRGLECRAPDGYAEAFTCRKIVVGT